MWKMPDLAVENTTVPNINLLILERHVFTPWNIMLELLFKTLWKPIPDQITGAIPVEQMKDGPEQMCKK